MLLELLFAAGLAAGGGGGSGAPSLTGAVTRTSHAGVCPGINDYATLTVAWTVANPDDTNYQTRVLENGALVSTQATSAMSFLKEIADHVVGGAYHRYTVSWTYTVQIVRISDGVVISSGTATVWNATYGTCSNAL